MRPLHQRVRSPRGRRVGWLLLISAVGLFAVASSRHWLPAGLVGPIPPGATPADLIPKELLQVFVAVAATAGIALLKGDSFTRYGLPGRKAFGLPFWKGAAWGFVMLTATITSMAATHSYAIASVALTGPDILKYSVLWAAAFLLVAIAEEVAFRGYLQYVLTSRFGFWPASVVTSVFFGFAHRDNQGENWIGLANIVVIGMFACVALRRTGSLWFAIGWHMAFDWGESFFYSVPNSGAILAGHLLNVSLHGSPLLTGGTVGPEASAFDLVATLAGMAILGAVYRDARYPQPGDYTVAPLSSVHGRPT